MLRFIIPMVLVTVVAWVMLYGLKPRMKQATWSAVRHTIVAVSIGIVVVGAVMVIFLFIGDAHGIN